MKQRMNTKNKKGSSLVFVIIAVAFVGILSTIILRATLINVETKGTDRSITGLFAVYPVGVPHGDPIG